MFKELKKETYSTHELLWGVTKTFSGKQAQSGNSGYHVGGGGWEANSFGQISQVEPSKALLVCTQKHGRKDHLETRSDICLSVNYSNKHAGEWHLLLDVSQRNWCWMLPVQTCSFNTQTPKTRKQTVQCTGACVL